MQCSGNSLNLEPLVCFRHYLGGQVGFEIDVYAFGVIMWQLYTSMQVYIGLKKKEVIQSVVKDNMRPRFPPWTPDKYKQLAESCWHADREKRPQAEEITFMLNEMMSEAGGMLHLYQRY